MAERKRLSAFDLIQQRNQASGSGSDFLARNPLPQAAAPAQQSGSAIGDFGTALKAGAYQIPSIVPGLMDIPAGLAGAAASRLGVEDVSAFNKPFSRAFGKLGDMTGVYDFDRKAEEARQAYSPEQKAAQQKIDAAEGFTDTVATALQNPRIIATTIGESLPSTLTGGVLAKGLGAAGRPLVAAGLGEGAVAAGLASSEMSADIDPGKRALGSLAIGAGVGLIGGLGGAAARKAGLSDIDLTFVGGAGEPIEGTARRKFVPRVLGGAFSEGVLEELPQSAYEALVGNWVADRPLLEGVGQQAALGMLAGAGMGAGVNVFGGRRDFVPEPPPADPQADPQADPEAPPLSPMEQAVSNMDNEQLFRTWISSGRLLDPEGETFSNQNLYEANREYRDIIRSEIIKRNLDPSEIVESTEYADYAIEQDRLYDLKKTWEASRNAGGKIETQARERILETQRKIREFEERNPEFAERFSKEGSKEKQEFQDDFGAYIKLKKKYDKLPKNIFSAKDKKTKADFDALTNKLNDWQQRKPEWFAEAIEQQEENIAEGKRATGSAAGQVLDDIAVGAAKQDDGPRDEFFFDEMSEDEVADLGTKFSNFAPAYDKDLDDTQDPVTIEGEAEVVQESGGTDNLPATQDDITKLRSAPVNAAEPRSVPDNNEVIVTPPPAASTEPAATGTEQIDATLSKGQKTGPTIAGSPTPFVEEFVRKEGNEQLLKAVTNQKDSRAQYSLISAKKTGLKSIESELNKAKANGTIRSIINEYKQKAVEDPGDYKKNMRWDFVKYWMDANDVPAETLADMREAAATDQLAGQATAVNDLASEQAVIPATTGQEVIPATTTGQEVAAVSAPVTAADVPSLVFDVTADMKARAEAASAQITSNTELLRQVYDSMASVPMKGRSSPPSPRQLEMFKVYLEEIVGSDNPIVRQQPWANFAELLGRKYGNTIVGRTQKGEPIYLGATKSGRPIDKNNLRNLMNEIGRHYVSVLTQMDTGIPTNVLQAIPTKFNVIDKVPNPTTREMAGIRATEALQESGVDLEAIDKLPTFGAKYEALTTAQQALLTEEEFYKSQKEIMKSLGQWFDFWTLVQKGDDTQTSREDRINQGVFSGSSSRTANVWAKIYTSISGAMTAKELADISRWTVESRKIADAIDNLESRIEIYKASIPSTARSVEDLLANYPNAQERYEWAVAEIGIEGMPSFEELVSSPDDTAIKQWISLPDLYSPEEFAAVEAEIQEMEAVLANDSFQDIAINRPDILENLELTPEEVNRIFDEGFGAFDADFIAEKVDAFRAQQRVMTTRALTGHLKKIKARYEGTAASNSETLELINIESAKLDELQKNLAAGQRRIDAIFEQAIAKTEANVKAAQRINARLLNKQLSGSLALPAPNSSPLDALSLHPLYGLYNNYQEFQQAQQEKKRVSKLANKPGATLAAIAQGVLPPFTWAEHSSKQKGRYITTLSPNGAVWTVRLNPETKESELWFLKDTFTGEVNPDKDVLWATSSDKKARSKLKEMAEFADPQLNYQVIDGMIAPSIIRWPTNLYYTDPTVRNRKRVEAANLAADIRAAANGGGAGTAPVSTLRIQESVERDDAPVIDKAAGTVTNRRGFKLLPSNYLSVRMRKLGSRGWKLAGYETYGSAYQKGVVGGGTIPATGQTPIYQVIGDPSTPGADNAVNMLADKVSFADAGGYQARLMIVNVPMARIGEFLGSESAAAIGNEADAQIALSLARGATGPASQELTGPVLNYATGAIKNIDHINSFYAAGAPAVKVSIVLDKANEKAFLQRMQAGGYDLSDTLSPEQKAFDVKVREYGNERDIAAARKQWRAMLFSYNFAGVTTPASVAEVKEAVARYINANQPVTVVNDLSDLKGLIEKNNLQVGPTAGAFVFQDRVYVIANNIQKGDVLGVLLHEVGVHTSMSRKMVSMFASEIQKLASGGNALAQEAVDQAEVAIAYSASMGAQLDVQALEQEIVAYFVEQAVNRYGVTPTQLQGAPAEARGILRKVLTYITNALRSLGIKVGRITPQNIVDTAFGMANSPVRRPMGDTEILMSVQNTQGALGRVQRQWEAKGSPGSSYFREFKQQFDRIVGRFMFTHDFANSVANWFPQMARYVRIMREQQAVRAEVDAEIQRTLEPFRKLPEKQRKKLMDFMYITQQDEGWAFDPLAANIANPTKPTMYDPDSTKAQAFDALSGQEQEMIKNVFRHAAALQERMHAAITNEIRVRYQSLIDDARSLAEVADLEKQKAKDLKAHDRTKMGRIAGWLPLRRHGAYAVVFKSDELQQLLNRRDSESGKNKATNDEITRLKEDPRHYEVQFFENPIAARELENQINAEGSETRAPGTAEHFLRESMPVNGDTVPAYLMNALESNLRDVEYVSDDPNSKQVVTANALRRAVNRMYIAGLADTNSRKSELTRENVAGADRDMLRGFTEYATSVGTVTASMRAGTQAADVIREMRNEIRKGGNRRKKSEVFNEIVERHIASIDPTPNPFADRTMAITSFWMLLSSPSYYMQNATQPWLMTLPALAGRFGFSRSAKALSDNYSLISKSWMAAHKDIKSEMARGDFKGFGGELADLEAIRSEVGEDAYQMLLDMKNQGVFDVGISTDLGEAKWFGDIHGKFTHAVRSVEVFNRGVTALAAFQLAKQQPNLLQDITVEGPDGPVTRQMTPQEFAFDAVMKTQGDYSGTNAPSIINRIPGGFGKVIFQFRKFQLIQINMLAEMIAQGFGDAPPVQKAIARRQLGYLIGANLAVGGVLALPAANIAGLVYQSIMRAWGDDEPDDIEMQIRQYVGDPMMADLILKGLPTLIDQDWSAKLGWGTTASLLPYTKMEFSRDAWYQTTGAVLMGPAGALGANVFAGAEQMLNGNLYSGASEMMPRGVRDAMRAVGQVTYGVRDRSPLQRVLVEADDVTGTQFLSQLLGSPSATTTRRQAVTRGSRNAKTFFNDRSEAIKAKYVQARRDLDPEAQWEAREEWRKLQAARAREGFPRQDISILTSAMQNLQEYERNVRSGVPFDTSTRRYVERRT